MKKLFNQSLKNYRSQIDELVRQLHDLTVQIGHTELAGTVSDLRNRINEPFMFVIVGEVKAGKSSFVNALLGTGKEICKVAPQPMTDTIQQILYGEEEEIISINEFLKKIYQPVEILKEIAIVDTPGTNAIVKHHQQITENFIPASDLIVFVFEAKNPYRQSAWDFFDYIHVDWRKKIVFVLQQKDLMSEEDLQVNINGVKDYAAKKGILNPSVFAVSAKQEQDGETAASGFLPVREYITDNITGGRAPVLKLQNNIKTSKNINERIYKGVLLRKEQNLADKDFRLDIRHTLEDQAVKSNRQVSTLVENLLGGYDSITRKTEDELKAGLSFGSLLKRQFSSLFTSGASAKDWLDQLSKDFENDLNTTLKDKLNDGVVDLAESIQQMAKIIDLKIQNSQTILKNNHEIFSAIAEKRSNILRELQAAFKNFLSRSENFADQELFPDSDNLMPNMAAGGGIAVIGIILATVTNGMVFDITGGVLSTIGLLFAGVSVGLKRRKVINGFQAEIAKGRLKIEEEVTSKLERYIQHIKNRIDANFGSFDELLANETKQIASLENKHQHLEASLDEIAKELGAVL
ncbi:MAG: dynamin family protein [Bacteroidota bacterium]